MGEGWNFRLLGPLEVRHDGVPVPVAAAKQRTLIAVLALAVGDPVPVDRLIACLWDDEPPASARNTLQNYVLRLRRLLRTDDRDPVETSAAGYRLDLPADAVDVHRFDALLRCARAEETAGDPESASALLDEALALWQAQPLTDVPSEVLHREVVPGLAERRLTALESRVDLDLRLGRHERLTSELVALTTAHPLRERLWAQRMLALYRSGRAAEALEAYQQAARGLAEELGVDPGPELRRLHQSILTNDPTLTAPRPRPNAPAAGPPAAVPRQLPAPGPHFAGRTAELDQLTARLDDLDGPASMPVSAIGGGAGIGKTALAVQWAHQHADRFPDGQLYVNLRGFDPGGTPVPPAVAVRGFLTALGVPAQQLPTDPDNQLALYRSRLADRRMLVLLDNARDSDQARPLLPGAPGCLVLVTSRNQLASLVALDGAVPLTLDLLTRAEARDLLARRLGGARTGGDESTVEELIDLCARLPLALNIAAAHAALHPTRPLATLVDELRDTRRRLDTLTTGEATADVRAVFSWSYRTLAPETARLFRLLGLHPGPDITPPAAAALAALDPPTTRRALDELTRAHLLTERAPGRHTQHDLLRAYAADQAHTHDSAAERTAALDRICDFSLHTAYAGARLMDPHYPPIHLDEPAPGVHPQPLPDVPAALAWFDAEHHHLLAAQQTAAAHRRQATVWQLAWALNTFLTRQAHRHDRVAVWRAALDAAEHLPDPAARIHAHRRLGHAHADLDHYDEGIDHLHRSLALAEEIGDPDEQAQTQRMLAWSWERRGGDTQALEHATRAWDLLRSLDHPQWEAETLNAMGWLTARMGDFDTARAHCEAALVLHRAHQHANGEAATLDSLGYIAHHTGDHHRAVGYYRQAVEMFRAVGNTSETVRTLEDLGHPHVALGEPDQARAAWLQARDLYREQGRAEPADRVQRLLDALDE